MFPGRNSPGGRFFGLRLGLYKIAKDVVYYLRQHFRRRELLTKVLVRTYKHTIAGLIHKTEPGLKGQFLLLVNQHHFYGLQGIIESAPVKKSFRVHEPEKNNNEITRLLAPR